ncbi:MAG: phosphoribosylanthranilate isomerase [Phascolarctobacterium sp.]|nr:phosphoribosylanthranilate isomerase [Phascolarctobacterium sp.]
MKKVKICGLRRKLDIEYVNQAKPDYVGFIINYPKSHRSITLEELQGLTAKIIPDIKKVGVFVNQPRDFVAELLNNKLIDIAQLHGDEDNSYIEKLREETGKEIWQAIVVRKTEDLQKALNSKADLILLDAGKGSGQVFDWSLLNKLSRKFALAGGLREENLDDALQTEAILLDVSGGVETDGSKDLVKIQKFIDIVRKCR